MSTKDMKKPFYLLPPWNILFDFHKLEKLTPWKVNIAFLLSSFLEEMKKRGEIDFRASGIALDSSAFLYLMKSKLLLRLEEPPARPTEAKDFVPPPLFLPLRYELMSTTIQNLLEVLSDVIKEEQLISLTKPRVEPILPPPSGILPSIDLYLMEIEQLMENLYASLHKLAYEEKPIIFSKLVEGYDRLETIRTFVLLLFLAQRGKVFLWQQTEFGEIYITLGEKMPIGTDTYREND